MFKKIFSLFLVLVILSSLVFVFYGFFFRKTTNSSKSSSSSKTEKTTKYKTIKQPTVAAIDNQNISHYSLALLKNSLSKVDHTNGKETVKINYHIPTSDFKNLNNYQISSIVFKPLFGEKLIIGQILTYFHAADLIITFQYGNSFTVCLVKIAYQKFPKIFTQKFYQISQIKFFKPLLKKNLQKT